MERTGSERDSTEDARADRSDAAEGASARGEPGVGALHASAGNQAVQRHIESVDEPTDRGPQRRDGTTDDKPPVDTARPPGTALPVQLQGGTTAQADSAVRSLARAGVRGPGRALPHRSRLEPHVDSLDLSAVTAHTDEAAQQATDALGVSAYAVGTDIALGDSADLEMVAHEVAHVVQQQHGEAPAGGIGRPGDAFERAADEFATSVTRGESVSALPSRAGRGDAAVARDAVQFQNGGGNGNTTEHTVDFHRSDGPYGWTVAYDVEITPAEVRITVGVEITPQSGVSDATVEAVEEEAEREFGRYFDGRFTLEDASGDTRPLRFEVDFDHSSPHHEVDLYPGDGRDNVTNWYANSEPITRAHELGHMLGLTDEYVDTEENVPGRNSASGSDVYRDNSLMGHFHDQGLDAADVRERHGEDIASDLTSETGSDFTAEMSPTYTVRPGDTLKNIALRVYRDENRWVDILFANTIRLDDLPVEPGTTLYLP